MAGETAAFFDVADYMHEFVSDNVAALEAQLAQPGFDLQHSAFSGNSNLLLLAAFFGAERCFAALVRAGGDPATARASSGLSANDFLRLRGHAFGVGKEDAAAGAGVASGAAQLVLPSPGGGMLPLPDCLPRPPAPLNDEHVRRVFALANAAPVARSTAPAASDTAGGAGELDVAAALPTALALLGLQWRPAWGTALRTGGTAAVRDALLDARKRWLKLYFGAGEFAFSGSAQLLTAQHAQGSAVSKALTALGELHPRQQMSPLLAAEPGDARRGRPLTHLSLRELAHLVCMLRRYEALAMYTSQWSVASSSSMAALLASPSHAFAVPLAFTDQREGGGPLAHRGGRGGSLGGGEPLAPRAERSASTASVVWSFSDTGPGADAPSTRVHTLSLDESGSDAAAPSPGAAASGGGGDGRPSQRAPRGLVFLGGACGPTTWRRRLAIPALGGAGIPFFNPQVEEWSPELVEVEAAKKREAGTLVFVISERTRSIASMIEAAEHITEGRRAVVLVIRMVPEAAIGHAEVSTADTRDAGASPSRLSRQRSGSSMGSDASGGGTPRAASAAAGAAPRGGDLTGLTASEQKDLNRGRTYLADIAGRHGLRVFGDVPEALAHLVQHYQRDSDSATAAAPQQAAFTPMPAPAAGQLSQGSSGGSGAFVSASARPPLAPGSLPPGRVRVVGKRATPQDPREASLSAR